MNRQIEEKLWQKAEKYVQFLQMLPFVRMVAVCNNLAFGRVDEKSDIDLFIIAKKSRLFTTRFFVTILLQIMGVRRHGKKVSERFCLSFFVDDSFLDFSKIAISNDIYLAFWLRSMAPLIDDGVSVDFLKENVWASRFFEKEDFNIDLSRVLPISRSKSSLNKFFLGIFNESFGDWFEKRMKNWQLKRSRKKMHLLKNDSGLVINEHILKFHNNDRRKEFRRAYFKKHGKDLSLSQHFPSFLDELPFR